MKKVGRRTKVSGADTPIADSPAIDRVVTQERGGSSAPDQAPDREDAWPPAARIPGERRRVVIVGSGFAGLHAATEFGRRYVTRWADVLVIDTRDYHLFTPLLYEAAVGAIQTRRLRYPTGPLFKRYGIQFLQTAVRGIDRERSCLIVQYGDAGGEIRYDTLILACGSQTNFFGRPELASFTLPLKREEDADRLYEQITACVQAASAASDPAERQRLLSFAIVGAGPTGVELAASLQQCLRARLLPSRRRGPRPSGQASRENYGGAASQTAGGAPAFRVILVEAQSTILPGMPPPVARSAAAELARAGITVLVDSPVETADAGGLALRGGTHLPAATAVWTAGIRPAPLPGLETAQRSPDGRLLVDSFLRLTGTRNIFVVGDMAGISCGDRLAPANAPAAVQMGKAAARNVTRSLLGLSLIAFRYDYEGDLLALGYHNAVAYVGGRIFTGYHAWVLRRAIYLANLMGVWNRVGLAADWWRSERVKR